MARIAEWFEKQIGTRPWVSELRGRPEAMAAFFSSVCVDGIPGGTGR